MLISLHFEKTANADGGLLHGERSVDAGKNECCGAKKDDWDENVAHALREESFLP